VFFQAESQGFEAEHIVLFIVTFTAAGAGLERVIDEQ
jgi:hypothetical protein